MEKIRKKPNFVQKNENYARLVNFARKNSILGMMCKLTKVSPNGDFHA